MKHSEVALFIQKSYPDQMQAIVIIVHGIAEHALRYEHVTQALLKHAYGVVRYDHRGHGQSAGVRGDIPYKGVFIDDLKRVVDEVKRDRPNHKIFLLGHSMGGYIVNAYATQYHDIDGIISSGAVAVFLKDVLPLRIIPTRLIGFLRHKNAFSAGISKDERVVKAYDADPLVLKNFTFRLVGFMFVSGVRFLRKHIKNHHTPTLFLHGKSDSVVPYQSSVWLHEHVSHSDNTLILLDGLYHEILNEPEKEVVISHILSWLNRQVKA